MEKINGAKEERNPFTDQQVKALLAVADQEWRGMILFGIHTGIRLHDCANLTYANINQTERVLTYLEEKTSRRKRQETKETILRMHPDIMQWINSRPLGIEKAPLFPTLHGQPSGSHGGLSNAFSRLMEKAGIKPPLGKEKKGKGRRFRKLGFHSFRHSFVSRLANEDVPADVRKQMVGQSSDEVHRRYVHLDLSAQDRAIAKLKSVL